MLSILPIFESDIFLLVEPVVIIMIHDPMTISSRTIVQTSKANLTVKEKKSGKKKFFFSVFPFNLLQLHTHFSSNRLNSLNNA